MPCIYTLLIDYSNANNHLLDYVNAYEWLLKHWVKPHILAWCGSPGFAGLKPAAMQWIFPPSAPRRLSMPPALDIVKGVRHTNGTLQNGRRLSPSDIVFSYSISLFIIWKTESLWLDFTENIALLARMAYWIHNPSNHHTFQMVTHVHVHSLYLRNPRDHAIQV